MMILGGIFVVVFLPLGILILLAWAIIGVLRGGKKNTCGLCGSTDLIPATSPLGQALIKQMKT